MPRNKWTEMQWKIFLFFRCSNEPLDIGILLSLFTTLFVIRTHILNPLGKLRKLLYIQVRWFFSLLSTYTCAYAFNHIFIIFNVFLLLYFPSCSIPESIIPFIFFCILFFSLFRTSSLTLSLYFLLCSFVSALYFTDHANCKSSATTAITSRATTKNNKCSCNSGKWAQIFFHCFLFTIEWTMYLNDNFRNWNFVQIRWEFPSKYNLFALSIADECTKNTKFVEIRLVLNLMPFLNPFRSNPSIAFESISLQIRFFLFFFIF